LRSVSDDHVVSLAPRQLGEDVEESDFLHGARAGVSMKVETVALASGFGGLTLEDCDEDGPLGWGGGVEWGRKGQRR
jgi:hypothetical protein